MERLRRTAIGLLLVVVGVTAFGATKPASLLLQEALYAEEIEGDLDAAIKIYEQVVREGEEAQRAAAQAAYRIGMCYLKKGDKLRAAEQFGEVLSKYPDEERVVARARRELSKLTPAAPEGLGAARELVIYSEESGKGFFFDIDSGESFLPGAGLTRKSPPSEVIAWCRSKGIDMVNEGGHLELLDMTVVEVAEEMWDSGGTADIRKALAEGPRKEVLWGQSRDFVVGSPVMYPFESREGGTSVSPSEAFEQIPVTYAFESREGGTGVLQVLDSRDKDVRIRYKIVSGGSIRPAGLGFGRVRTVELFDIDDPEVAGRACAVNLDNDKVLIIPEEVREGGDDAVKMWLGKGKVDVVAEIASEGRGLVGIQMAVKELPAQSWDGIIAASLRRLMAPGRAVVRETSEIEFKGEGERPVFAFRTAEGTYGVLRILDVSESRHLVKFEYKTLEEVSLETLKKLGLAAAMYANEHGDKLPEGLDGLKPYLRGRDFEWIVANVEYVGAGMRMDASVHNVVTAYDRTLLAEGTGTNVLFADGHVEFVGPEQLGKLGIGGGQGRFASDAVMKAEVYDNGMLDLETGAVLTQADKSDGSLKFYDVGWDNDGGGALMVVPGSSARILALAGAEDRWEAGTMARDVLSLLKASTSHGLAAGRSRFAAVLTDGGKVAVVEIVQYGPEKGLLQWWFQGPLAPAFSPVQTVSLPIVFDEREETRGRPARRVPVIFDFDRGRTLQIPPELIGESSDTGLDWALNSGGDAVGGIDDRE
ncbi:MAG: tetratricopeptide repeat protein, partial [Phycisphaerales bacterium]